jgi:hypothetical protein
MIPQIYVQPWLVNLIISFFSLLSFLFIRTRKNTGWRDIREGAFAPKLPTPGEKPVTIRQRITWKVKNRHTR